MDANVNGSTHQHAVATNAGHHGAIVRLTDENARLKARIAELEDRIERALRLVELAA